MESINFESKNMNLVKELQNLKSLKFNKSKSEENKIISTIITLMQMRFQSIEESLSDMTYKEVTSTRVLNIVHETAKKMKISEEKIKKIKVVYVEDVGTGMISDVFGNAIFHINALEFLKLYDIKWLENQAQAENWHQLPLSLLSFRLERILKKTTGGFIFTVGHELSHFKHQDNDRYFFESAKIIFNKLLQEKKRHKVIDAKKKEQILGQAKKEVCEKSIRKECRADKEALDYLGGGEDAILFFSMIKNNATKAGVNFDATNETHPLIDERIALAKNYTDRKIATLEMKSDWWDLYNDLYDWIKPYSFAALTWMPSR
jgi:hypothetical protein